MKRPRGVARSLGRSGHLKGSADESDALSTGLMTDAPAVGVARETPRGPVLDYATPSFRPGASTIGGSAGTRAVSTGQTAGIGQLIQWKPSNPSEKALYRQQSAGGAIHGAVGTSHHGQHGMPGPSAPMDGSHAPGLTLNSIPPPPPPPDTAASRGAGGTGEHPPLTMTGRTAWSNHAVQVHASAPAGAPGAMGWGMGQGRGIFSSQLRGGDREVSIGGHGQHQHHPNPSGAAPTASLSAGSGSMGTMGLGGSGGPWAAQGSNASPHGGVHPGGGAGRGGASRGEGRGGAGAGARTSRPDPWGEADGETTGGYTPSSSSGNTYESFGT